MVGQWRKSRCCSGGQVSGTCCRLLHAVLSSAGEPAHDSGILHMLS